MIGELYKKFIVDKNNSKTSVGSQKIETSLNPKSETLPARQSHCLCVSARRQVGAGGNPKQIQNSKSKNIKKKIVKPKLKEKFSKK